MQRLHACKAFPQRPKPVPMNAIHCSGQRGAETSDRNLLEDDTRRP